MSKHLFTVLDLHLFDGEGGAPVSDGGGEAPIVKYGKQEDAPAAGSTEPAKQNNPDAAEARKAEFEKLIKEDYRDLYDERVQKIVKDRLKDHNALKSKVDSLDPVLDMLSSKYGVDKEDAKALAKALEEDSSYYEQEALEKGLTVEQLKQMKKLERENAEFKRAAQEQQKKANADKIFAQWQQQSDVLKTVYPGFDLQYEASHPETGSRFMALLGNGVDVKTAYEVIHKDEIMGGAMQYTAQTVQQKVVNDIKARGMRPPENGVSGTGAAVVTKKDPSKLTNKELAEISKLVRAGERIVF